MAVTMEMQPPPPTQTLNQLNSEKSSKDPAEHVRATPAFEISSVTITKEAFKGAFKRLPDENGVLRRVELYGYIKLVDEYDNEFLLLDYPCTDPETVYLSEDKLDLLRESNFEHPYWLLKSSLIICLKDRRRDILIVEDRREFDFTSMDANYVIDKRWRFKTSNCGHLIVNYRVFPYAVSAFVQVQIYKNSASGLSEDIFNAVATGTISSTCKKWDHTLISRVLYDETSYDPTNVASVDLIFDSWLTVPAYCTATEIIITDLVVDGDKIGGDHVFSFPVSDDSNCVPMLEDYFGKNWCIRVRVCWFHLSAFLGKKSYGLDRKRIAEVVSKEESEDHSTFSYVPLGKSHKSRKRPNRMQEKYSDIYDPSLACHQDVDIKWGRTSHFPSYRNLVEIFSISVISVSGKQSKLHGIIQCYDSFDTYNIFRTRKGEYVELDNYKNTLLVQEPCVCYIGEQFGLYINLMDDQDYEISKGSLVYRDGEAERWHDKRMCSVIPGKFGFAAVRYTIFGNAVQARVKVVFMSDNVGLRKVRGKIFARYGSYKYSTYFDEKYYQSKLFENCVELKSGDTLPLSKPVVAVPVYDMLIVEAYLRISGVDKNLKGKVTFEAVKPKNLVVHHSGLKIIKGPDFSLEVSVDWG